ncbi:DUF4268 domain-containing protein [Maritimibacter sp. DP1N21-5]|nr:DUF4268 domain-containing protein [Maritimibacter sp. DP1N21-5]
MGIYQQYLERNGGGDAAGRICEFLGEDTLDEVVLNDGTNQRIVFIAANFRKEVTATVLWLREHQIDARCVKVIPYRFEEEVFVDLQQVIPTPEAADYMIRMAEKDIEEKSAKGASRRGQERKLAFWTLALEELAERGRKRFQNLRPSRDNWMSCGIGIPECALSLVIAGNETRVDIVLQRRSAQENKWIFD